MSDKLTLRRRKGDQAGYRHGAWLSSSVAIADLREELAGLRLLERALRDRRDCSVCDESSPCVMHDGEVDRILKRLDSAPRSEVS